MSRPWQRRLGLKQLSASECATGSDSAAHMETNTWLMAKRAVCSGLQPVTGPSSVRNEAHSSRVFRLKEQQFAVLVGQSWRVCLTASFAEGTTTCALIRTPPGGSNTSHAPAAELRCHISHVLFRGLKDFILKKTSACRKLPECVPESRREAEFFPLISPLTGLIIGN